MTESSTFSRIAIVNRGEAAMRLVRAVREARTAFGNELISIALYTDSDRQALFVREADEAHHLGPASFVDPADGRRKNGYLDYRALERAIVESRAEAVWVGWGFVSEHADFADLCRKLGVVFLGPSPEVMRELGDKIGSKRVAEEVGVPVAPWSGGPVETADEARRVAHSLGYPLMVKATAGGGGRGIRKVRSEAELEEAFTSARAEALASCGDATVFMERLLEGSRHIEVQIVGDGQGTTWALGVRDCTVQRRNQKVIEESPSAALTPDQHREICEAAARLGTRVGYRGAGTVEFLYDPVQKVFSFMEVNARLQVEHPVTEETTGADLVKLQLHVGRGLPLKGDPPQPVGHAIEVRVNAEDPERGFAPAPGLIELARWPGGAGVRIDTGFVEGDRVAAEFDSMLAKLIVHGRDRDEALARLRRALSEMRLAVRGGASNRGFLLGLIQHPDVVSNEVDVGWLDRLAATGEHLTTGGADVALVQAAIDGYDDAADLEQNRFFATAARGRLGVGREVGLDFELRCRGVRYDARVFRTGPESYRVELDGQRIEAVVERLSTFERRLRIGEVSHSVLTLPDGPDLLVEVEGIAHRISRDDVGMVRAPSPAVVLSVRVAVGERVEVGDRLAVLEAMKTELPVVSPCAGVVSQVLVTPNVQVDAGAPLLVIAPEADAAPEERGDRVDFAPLATATRSAATGHSAVSRILEELRRLMLGFDIAPEEAGRLVRELASEQDTLAADDPALLEGEARILSAFADVCALFEGRAEGAPVGRNEARTSEEYMLLYVRSLDPVAAGVSPGFIDRLQRVLTHYGIDELERTPALEQAIVLVCKAHVRIEEEVDIVLRILQRRLESFLSLLGDATPALRSLLDRVVVASGRRYPAVRDLARELRYRLFDRPFFERIKDGVYANVEAQLAAAGREGSGRSRAEYVRELVECPQPLAPLLMRQLSTAAGDPRAQELCLEILLRRYYRIRSLRDVQGVGDELWGAIRAEYEHPEAGVRIRALACHARWEELDGLLGRVPDFLPEAEAGVEDVVDLLVLRPEGHGDENEVADELRDALNASSIDRRLRRVVVIIGEAGSARGLSALQHFTFRPSPEGYVEDQGSRGLHPMMGKRLQLWRLSNFEVERIPSVEDVYLFHAVGREMLRDERLFAFAEVRDLTPVLEEGRSTPSFPHLEMQFHEALAAIRLFQSRRSSRRRLHWNRVVLYVWPPLEQPTEQIRELAHRLMPATEGLGLQKTVVRARVPDEDTGRLRETVIEIDSRDGREVAVRFRPIAERPIAPLSPYAQQVVRMRQRGLFHPYELARTLAPAETAAGQFPRGDFQEYDLDESDRLVSVDRPPGGNTAHLVVGVIRNFTAKHPEGMTRVILISDPSRGMGNFAEPECRRIIGAVELAESMGVPVEWFPISAGAKIAMDSGTENLDWTAAALRSLIEFTQRGGEVNVIVVGINVGGQSYWNAEATMLMHTRGILVMTPDASIVLTGKKALDYAGSVSAEDHPGIGGYDRIMGVNGQAQYWARDVGEAARILFRYYEHAYVVPGERFPRRAPTSDPADRDIRAFPYAEDANDRTGGFDTIGEIFSEVHNPGRRKPFEIRRVMRAIVDRDQSPLERWADMREAETAVVWDAHLGGMPVCLIGMESAPVPRLGFVPADGPDQWTAGTLFPLSSKKIARAINAASGSRPVVVLANLSGFDGSPESLRRLQLEYGAEIGRAVVNFDGPIVFCVVSRYHGGAYVVFSRRLHENLEVAALEGSYASVIGGAPAAAVVFAGDVDQRTRADARLHELQEQIDAADEGERGRLRARWHELYDQVHSEKLGEVAEEFDRTHDVHRAQRVGSLDEIVEPGQLRPYLIGAVERGVEKALRTAGGDVTRFRGPADEAPRSS